MSNSDWSVTMPKVMLPSIRAAEYRVADFGAVGDGMTLDTDSVQAAVDRAYADGGGRVIVSEGRYLTGSILLRSGVELHLERGATLLGATNREHYRRQSRWYALVLAEAQHDIAITGQGEIDGQGRELALDIDQRYHAGEYGPAFEYTHHRKRPHESERPQIIELTDCARVLVSGVTIRDSSSWVQTYVRCSFLEIDSVRIESDAYWNNDGIDIEDCSDVRIRRCDINSADDGICLKSDREPGNRRVLVSGCRIRSSANAVKFGTPSAGGFRDVRIEDISVFDTYRSAVALECVDGGILENVDVSGITVRNSGNAVFIRLGNRNSPESPGSCRNIRIRNVRAEIVAGRPDAGYDIRGPALATLFNPIPASITGVPGHLVENVVLEDIRIDYDGGGNPGMAHIPVGRLSEVPEQLEEYPEYSMFGELPAWGLFVRHARAIELRDVTLRTRRPDFRPALVFDDVADLLALNEIDLPRTSDDEVVFHDVAPPVTGGIWRRPSSPQVAT